MRLISCEASSRVKRMTIIWRWRRRGRRRRRRRNQRSKSDNLRRSY